MEYTTENKQNNTCIICGAEVISSFSTCGSNICAIRYEEVDVTHIKNEVTYFIQTSTYALQFMWNISYSAIKSCPKRFRPFPNYFIKNKLNKTYTRGDIKDIMNTVVADDEVTIVRSIFDSVTIGSIIKLTSNTDSQLIVDLKSVTDKPVMLYYLLRFLILSNRTIIDTTLQEFSFNNNETCTVHIHKIKYSDDKEQKFGRSSDVNYLYHGSPSHNWHSMLRNGIKNCSGTGLMTTGAVSGKGIYLSNNINTSMAYVLSSTMIAIVELTGNIDKWAKGGGVFVVPDESAIIIRYLINVPRKIKSNHTLITSLGEFLKDKMKTNLSSRKLQLNHLKSGRMTRIKQELLSLRGLNEYMEINQTNIKIAVVKAIKSDNNKTTITYPMMINDENVLVTISVHFPPTYPFVAPIIRIICPQIHNNQITSSGIFSDPSLFGKAWRPVTKLVSIMEHLHNIMIMSEIKSMHHYKEFTNDYKNLCSSAT